MPNNHTSSGPPSAPNSTYSLPEACLPCHVGKELAPAHAAGGVTSCGTCHYPAGSVTGYVYGTSGALEGVTVEIGASRTARTYAGGQYVAANVPVGTYDLTFSAPGYVSRTVTGVAVTDGGTAARSVTLDPVAVPDTSAPVTTCDASGPYTGSAAVTLAALDAGGSGVAHTWFRLDGAAPVEGTTVTVNGPGSHTLEYWSVDRAGNEETHHTAIFTVVEPGPAATWLTILASATSARRGQTVVLSGTLSDPTLVGRIVVVYVQRPGRAYWTYSSNRVAYSRYGVSSWQYKYLFKSGMPLGTYRFKAALPAGGGFAGSVTPNIVSVRLR